MGRVMGKMRTTVTEKQLVKKSKNKNNENKNKENQISMMFSYRRL